MTLTTVLHYRADCDNAKLGQEGSRDLLLKFWDPLHISETVEGRNFKFGTQIGH